MESDETDLGLYIKEEPICALLVPCLGLYGSPRVEHIGSGLVNLLQPSVPAPTFFLFPENGNRVGKCDLGSQSPRSHLFFFVALVVGCLLLSRDVLKCSSHL